MSRCPGWRSVRAMAMGMLLLLGGCSTLSFAWQYVDGILVERVDDWVALTPAQRSSLQQQLQPWLDRVAVHRFPEYIDFFREAARRTRGGIEPADGPWAYRRALTLYRELQDDALAHWIGPALAGLGDAQVRHMRARMRAENAAYRERYLAVSRRESRRALASRIIDVVDDWTGPLDVDQVQLMNRGARELPDTSLQWYRYRLRKQAGLLALLRSDPAPAAIADHLGGWWIERRGLDPAEQERFERFQQQLVALLTELALSLSPEQRASVDRRLRTIADELEVIRREAIGEN